MPKKEGVSKTYSFDRETIEKLIWLCKAQKRSQTNFLEKMINDTYEQQKTKYTQNEVH